MISSREAERLVQKLKKKKKFQSLHACRQVGKPRYMERERERERETRLFSAGN